MTADRPFRFGVLVPDAPSGEAVAEIARRAEGLGYSTLFVPDHFVDHPLGPWSTLGLVAGVTTTLRLGTLVLGNDYRHPVVVAREAATLDLLSNGRLELGVGAGWMTVDYERAGISLDRPSVRIERLEESIRVIKSLFADGECTFHGEHYQVSGLDGHPKPVQRPHPPFIVGGGAPKILGVAARQAQIVGINANLRSGTGTSPDAALSMTPAATDEKLVWLKQEAGDGFVDLEIQTLVGFAQVTDDPEPVLGMIADGFDISPADAKLVPVTLIGSTSEMVDLLEIRRDRWDMTYHVVGVDAMDSLGPVVERLAG